MAQKKGEPRIRTQIFRLFVTELRCFHERGSIVGRRFKNDTGKSARFVKGGSEGLCRKRRLIS